MLTGTLPPTKLSNWEKYREFMSALFDKHKIITRSEMRTDDSNNTIQEPPSTADDETVLSTDRTSSGIVKPSFSNRLQMGGGTKRPEIADIEQTTIVCLRYFIAFLMILSTIAAAMVTWSILEEVEVADFESKVSNISSSGETFHRFIISLHLNNTLMSFTIITV